MPVSRALWRIMLCEGLAHGCLRTAGTETSFRRLLVVGVSKLVLRRPGRYQAINNGQGLIKPVVWLDVSVK